MNTQIIKYALALVGIATLTACSTGDSLIRVDQNKDGGVSFKEFDAYMKDDIFKKFDTDGNGSLSVAEIKAFKALIKKAPGKTELDKINNTTKSS
jgi:Ca2+-binding EF-hand superfamily protein